MNELLDFFGVFVCFVVLVFLGVLRIFENYGFGAESVVTFVFALEVFYFYMVLFSFKRARC